MSKQRYLVEYEGYVTGSLGGRDDGYPCDKQAVFDSLESLVESNILSTNTPSMTVSTIIPVDRKTFEKAVIAIKVKLNKARETEKRTKLQAEYDRLGKLLGKGA